MSKEEVITKSLEQFKYKTPLKVEEPVWSTDQDAIRWNKGGYTKSKLPSGVYRSVLGYELLQSCDNLGSVSVFNLECLCDKPLGHRGYFSDWQYQ